MKILHLSDFHYKGSVKDRSSQDIIVDKLLESISQDEKIDFLLFTGDLVSSGSKRTDFDDAYKSLLFPVAKKLGMLKRNIIICPGNHDVDRSAVSEPIKDYIREIDDSEKLIQLVKENKPDVFGLSCKPTANYRDFESRFYAQGIKQKMDYVESLYSLHIRPIENETIGFVSINSAWCSTGDDDPGNLFFPMNEIESAVKALNKHKVTWRAILIHHPISDLRYFNKMEIEDIVYDEFHFLFSGHLHKREDFLRLTHNEGLFGTHAHAAFTKKKDGKVGYSILEFDMNTLDVILRKFNYDFEERTFFPLKEIPFSFPCNETKKEQVRIFKTLKKRASEVIEKANEICVTTKSNNEAKGFLELFVEPVLKREPQNQLMFLSRSQKIETKKLLEEKNFIILGKDKTGKTSLLYKIQIDLLNNFSQLGEIPLYIDLLEHKKQPEKFEIKKLLSRYLELSASKTDELLKRYKIKLLLDNFDPSNQRLFESLSSFFKNYPKCKFIIVSDQTLAQSYEKIDYGIDGYEKLFIHDISKREIRELTKKWPNIPKTKQDDFVDKITEVLKQHSMPFNFWTLSIFLWIFSGKNTLNFNNNSELLELYIDDILDRNKLASDPQNRFSYSNYKLLLSELAYKLLKDHSETVYSLKYSEFTNFVDQFKSQNIRRVGRTSEIISHLLARGVLKKNDDDYVTFRLNGVFEYFLAFNLIENKDLYQTITTNDDIYLSFKNEFEIYSGFSRSEAENRLFLDLIFSKSKTALAELNERMTGSLDLRLDKILDEKSQNQLLLNKVISDVAGTNELQPLSDDEKDDLFDEFNSSFLRDVDVRPKKQYDASLKNFDTLERYLIINGRVFRNIDNIKNLSLISDVFDFIIDSSCNLGFLLLEELETSSDGQASLKIDITTPKRLLIHLITNYLPSLVQAFVYESIGHVNLEEVIIGKLENLKKRSQTEQYKIFILYSLLLDIDFHKYKKHIDELIKLAKLGVIKSSIVLKLFYLLLFKAYDNDDLIAFLKERIRKLNKEINPEANLKDFDKKFEQTKKLLLLKRRES